MFKFPTAAVALLTAVQVAQAQRPNWVLIGPAAENGKLFIDTTRITSTTYPMGAAGNLVGALTPKVYKEAWVTWFEGEKIIAQMLWVFDCGNRAGELAMDTNDKGSSYDNTSSAQSIGVERYMKRIPPNSFYEMAQPIICKKQLPR